MSPDRQLPHKIIRDYLDDLVHRKKAFTREDFLNHFVDVYRRDVPDGEDAPAFKEVHRRDELKAAKAKTDSNFKKLWRAIDGETYFPFVFVDPILDTLATYDHRYALELDRLLLRNRGWLAVRIPSGVGGHADIYSNVLLEFSEANTELAKDLADDGVLNNGQTKKEVLDVIEALATAYIAACGEQAAGELMIRINKGSSPDGCS